MSPGKNFVPGFKRSGFEQILSAFKKCKMISSAQAIKEPKVAEEI